MMKSSTKWLFGLLLLVLLAGIPVVSANDIDPPVTKICGAAESYPLFAGQTIPVGTVEVTNDESSLIVTFQTTGNWYLYETHVIIGEKTDAGCTWPEGTTTNNGNPIPGQFPYGHPGDLNSQEDEIVIDLDDLSTEGCYCIAAHAKVNLIPDGFVIRTETAWGGTNPFGGRTWAKYLTYCLQPCVELWKTADTYYTRTYEWGIDKTCPDFIAAAIIGTPPDVTPQPVDVDYEVTMTVTDVEDSDAMVKGVIHIKNLGPGVASIVGIEDNADGTDAEISTACDVPFDLAVGGEKLCRYVVSFPTLDDVTGECGTNTVTVQLDNLYPPPAYFQGSYSKDYCFGFPTDEVHPCVDVTDDPDGSIGRVCQVDTDKTLEYAHTWILNDEFGTYTRTNTATFEDPDDATYTDDDSCTTTISLTDCPEWTNEYTIPGAIKQCIDLPNAMFSDPKYSAFDNVILGTEGADVGLEGFGACPASTNNLIFGFRGNDVIYGVGGNDAICGGPQDDEINGGPGNDIINAGRGNDKVNGDTVSGLATGTDTCDGYVGLIDLRKVWGGTESCEIFNNFDGTY